MESDVGTQRRRLQNAAGLNNAQLRDGFIQVMGGGMNAHDADKHFMVVCEAHTYANCQVREEFVAGRRGLKWGWSMGRCWTDQNKYGVGG